MLKQRYEKLSAEEQLSKKEPSINKIVVFLIVD
jgi:hypothetical protein